MLLFYEVVVFLGAFLLTIPFALHSRGRIRLRERFGSWNLEPGRYLWFHGASLGEVQGLLPIIKAVRKSGVTGKILLTATSPTGLTPAQELVDAVRLLPFDCRYFHRRALAGIDIQAFIFGETELWPALLSELSKRKCPIVLVNGRISDFTAKQYRLLKSLLRPVIERLSGVCAGDEATARRVAALGLADGKVHFTGNTKYDRIASVKSSQDAAIIKAQFFTDSKPIHVLGSIHPAEAQLWFPVMKSALDRYPGQFHVVVAPRHQERFDYFKKSLIENNFKWAARSSMTKGGADPAVDIILLDTIGELEQVYSFANAAFIGGSLISLGGHNPLEAAVYGTGLVMGPSRQNIKDLAECFIHEGALEIVANQAEIESWLIRFIQSPVEVRSSGLKAKQLALSFQGATDKTMSVLKSVGALNG